MRSNQALGETSPPRPGSSSARPGWATPACLLLAALIGGCDWLAQPGVDARREGNFQDGLRWKEQGRPLQARDSFYRALDVNPQNFHAHLQLGDLYRTDGSNQVRSVYHYERYKELAAQQSDGGKFRDQSADDGIRNAKIELARQYANTLLNDQRIAELDALRRTNTLLAQQVRVLQDQNSQLARNLASLTNALYAPPTAQTSAPPSLLVAQDRTPPAQPATTPPTPVRQPVPSTPTATTRSHRVAAGDTFSRIASQYGIRPAALQSANPRVDPRRLKPGMVLVIPAK